MNHDEHIREHIAFAEYQMPPGFEDGPAQSMSPVVYWWLSLTLLVTAQVVQDQPLWKQMVRNLNHTADGLDEDRWDILDDWLARAFKDISAALPDTLAKTVRTAARLRTVSAVESARLAVQQSDEYIAEAGEVHGAYTSLHSALDGWVLFVSQYVRPAAVRHPEVLRSAATAAYDITPLRAKANLTYSVMDLLGSLSHPTSNPKRPDGKRSARSPRFPGHNYPY